MGKKLTNSLQIRSSRETAPFFVGMDGRGKGGEKVISGSGSIKRRSEKTGKTVGNENKILVLVYFGAASKFWARF